jgi:predicted RNA binding protein YcfA (HicA-like mRNA interferase family)
MRVSDVDVLLYAGWYWVRNASAHRQFKHPQVPGRVTVAGRPGEHLAPRAIDSILKQTGLLK